jgi:hypothetical protein
MRPSLLVPLVQSHCEVTVTWRSWLQKFNSELAIHLGPDERVDEIVSTQNRSLIWEKMWWAAAFVVLLLNLMGFQSILQSWNVGIAVGLLVLFVALETFVQTMKFRYFVVTDERVLIFRRTRFARPRCGTLVQELARNEIDKIPTRRWSSFEFRGTRYFVRFFFTPLSTNRLIR